MTAIDPKRLAFLIDFVRDHTGNEHDASKAYLFSTRLAPVAASAGCGSVDRLVDRLRRRPSEALVQEVIDAMTTNETSFFRDRHPFETLAREVMPAMIEARRSHRRLNLWSAAASTGQEAYSLIILLKERFGELADWRVRVMGTDISATALRHAREGLYSPVAVGRGLSTSQLLRHFVKEDGGFRVSENLRQSATFRRLNLLDSLDGIPPMDVIFLRYVLIYFEPDEKRQILERVSRILRPGGVLFLGTTELLRGSPGGLRRVQEGRTVFYRPAVAEAA